MIMFVLLNDVSWKRERKFMMVIMKETWRWGATTVQQRYSDNWSGYILNHVLAPVNVCVWAIVCVGGTLLSWRAASTEMLHNSINNPPSEHSGARRVTTIQELHQRICEDLCQPNQLRSGKWLKKLNNQKKRHRNKGTLSNDRSLAVSSTWPGCERLPQTVWQEQNWCQRWQRSRSERSAHTQTAGTGLRLPAADCSAPQRTCRLLSGPATDDSSPAWSLHVGPGADRTRFDLSYDCMMSWMGTAILLSLEEMMTTFCSEGGKCFQPFFNRRKQ